MDKKIENEMEAGIIQGYYMSMVLCNDVVSQLYGKRELVSAQ